MMTTWVTRCTTFKKHWGILVLPAGLFESLCDPWALWASWIPLPHATTATQAARCLIINVAVGPEAIWSVGEGGHPLNFFLWSYAISHIGSNQNPKRDPNIHQNFGVLLIVNVTHLPPPAFKPPIVRIRDAPNSSVSTKHIAWQINPTNNQKWFTRLKGEPILLVQTHRCSFFHGTAPVRTTSELTAAAPNPLYLSQNSVRLFFSSQTEFHFAAVWLRAGAALIRGSPVAAQGTTWSKTGSL